MASEPMSLTNQCDHIICHPHQHESTIKNYTSVGIKQERLTRMKTLLTLLVNILWVASSRKFFPRLAQFKRKFVISEYLQHQHHFSSLCSIIPVSIQTGVVIFIIIIIKKQTQNDVLFASLPLTSYGAFSPPLGSRPPIRSVYTRCLQFPSSHSVLISL